jgi:hypothetical protein
MAEVALNGGHQPLLNGLLPQAISAEEWLFCNQAKIMKFRQQSNRSPAGNFVVFRGTTQLDSPSRPYARRAEKDNGKQL